MRQDVIFYLTLIVIYFSIFILWVLLLPGYIRMKTSQLLCGVNCWSIGVNGCALGESIGKLLHDTPKCASCTSLALGVHVIEP